MIFDNIDEKQLEKILLDNDENDFMPMLAGTEGFVKFVIYANVFNQTQLKIQELLSKVDLRYEEAYAAFEKMIGELFDEEHEIIFTLLDDLWVRKAVCGKMNWEEAFLADAQELYESDYKKLLETEEQMRFLEYRTISDLLSENFSHPFLREVLFEQELKEPFSVALREVIGDVVREKFETSPNQYVFLSIVLKLSTVPDEERSKCFKEVKKIHAVNKRFFSKEQKKVFQNLKELVAAK